MFSCLKPGVLLREDILLRTRLLLDFTSQATPLCAYSFISMSRDFSRVRASLEAVALFVAVEGVALFVAVVCARVEMALEDL